MKTSDTIIKPTIDTDTIEGKFISFENENYYKITNSNEMRPFFMSIVSDSNHWMFISSNGGLTAGRKNSEFSLFPYYTDDKITESSEITGSKSIFHVFKNSKKYLWEPFSIRQEGLYTIQRNLYKNSYGNKVIFEEINHDLQITFRYQWSSSNRFGFVRNSTLINHADETVEIALVDGIQNIIPAGISSDLQNSSSNLVDAYKKCELEPAVGLGIYALSAVIVDKAEPSEALKANIAWSAGIENPTYLISSLQLNNFRKGKEIIQEVDIKAEKGAYFIASKITLSPQERKDWMLVANVNQTMVNITEISNLIQSEKNIHDIVTKDVELGTKNLIDLTGSSDGIQLSADKLRNTRHFSNTLFNIMRGGIFDDNYDIERGDFIKYIEKANKKVFKKREALLLELPEVFNLNYLKELVKNDRDKNFIRLAFEYLPLKFSRRHGDPSRPWNKFSINTTTEDGAKVLDYQGNWRDIFQNWEALAHAYPEFIDSMIHKFLNASTFDGYNPYRVTKDGFDWEIIEPNDPWSYIGYWGDHQIIYLLKFLEFIEGHYPGKLEKYFAQDIFVYANVPYKIKPYEDILKNSKDTIVFDEALDIEIRNRREQLGADGALLTDEVQSVYKVNLIEKLLATVLAKMSNFIPEGGIWMNTQRPEWNDANNALVGNGVSMVTLYYLRRFINFFEKIIAKSTETENQISEELTNFFHGISQGLETNKNILSKKITDRDRKTVLDALGASGSAYREQIYNQGFTSKKGTISKKDLLHFFEITKQYLDQTIQVNKRADKLFHAYNLMTLKNNEEVTISYLPEMLEGQVAVLSSGYVAGKDAVELLDALRNSALFREDQYSYILYPNKELPRFIAKNNIDSQKVQESALLNTLLQNGNKDIIEQDANGNFHFNANFNNAESLKAALANLPKESYGTLLEKDASLVLDVFENIFDHKSFTGRSGTFFGYEGLGSIYWHMVSKLVLSIQEICLEAVDSNEDPVVIGRLFDHYFEANEGIGVHKSPELYGAFPTDPYSHTPGGKGAQQPGMTGQVKEDLLSRFGELGIGVKNGKIYFAPVMLRKDEFLKTDKTFRYQTIQKETKEIQLDKDTLCFTYCQIPVVYQLAATEKVEVHFQNGNVNSYDQLELDENLSQKIFKRTGEIEQIIVAINK